MPIIGQIVLNGDGFLEIASGVITGHEVLRFLDDLLESPTMPNPYFVFLDYSKVEAVKASIHEVREVAMKGRLLMPRSRRTSVFAVIASKPIVFGLARMWQMFVEFPTGWHIRVFYQREEALAWLQSEVHLRHQYALPPPAEWLPPEP